MTVNYVTITACVVILLSVAAGLHRRFGREAGYLVARVFSLAVGAVAVIGAWQGTQYLVRTAPEMSKQSLPEWALQLVNAWQQAPQLGRVVAFIIIYLIISNVLQVVLGGIPLLVSRIIPGPIANNSFLGGVLGVGLGVVRIVLYGAFLFLGLQWIQLPQIQSQANASWPYKTLVANIYKPYLQKFITQELPVLTQSAVEPLSQSIQMLAVPTGAHTASGVLVVPPKIATLAKQITSHDTTSMQKAKDLYEWEIHHIRYDWKKYNDFVYHQKWDQQTPLQTLETGKGVCADYAMLYADMAHSVGIPVQIDEGIGGTGGSYGPHAWNKVLNPTTQQWIPVDTTWGAEQDAWFGPPGFSQTHVQQQAIVINGDNA